MPKARPVQSNPSVTYARYQRIPREKKVSLVFTYRGMTQEQATRAAEYLRERFNEVTGFKVDGVQIEVDIEVRSDNQKTRGKTAYHTAQYMIRALTHYLRTHKQ